MASLFVDRRGTTVIQFSDDDGRRRTVRVGYADRRSAEAIRTHVERLALSLRIAQPAPPETLRWAAAIGHRLHEKLAKAGLVEPRIAPDDVAIGSFLDKYIERRTDLKKKSRENLKQVRDGLVAHFGKGRDMRTITKGEIGDWHRSLKTKLAAATIAGHIKKGRTMFKDAVDRNLIPDSPMAGLKAGSMSNDQRKHYVTVADVAAIIDVCPDSEWRVIFALARYAGLRVPSETNRLKWSDIDWERHRMVVHSPKTEHHQGKATRIVPIFPQLYPYLREAFERADEGAVKVITRHRGENLRTHGARIVKRAGIEPWEKLFQNMRSSCETDLTATFPLHVACAWVGNSEAVARQHYLQVTDQHFEKAIGQKEIAAPPPQPDSSSISAKVAEWWTVREVADLLRFDHSTVTRWCITGKIRAAKLPGGAWRIHKSVVDELLAGGLPEKPGREAIDVDPIWEAQQDHFAS